MNEWIIKSHGVLCSSKKTNHTISHPFYTQGIMQSGVSQKGGERNRMNDLSHMWDLNIQRK